MRGIILYNSVYQKKSQVKNYFLNYKHLRKILWDYLKFDRSLKIMSS